MSKAPFAYFGGKQNLAPSLLELLPPHDVYVECCGGSAALLFAKSPAPLEVYNDLDSGLVNFFRVLRDTKRAKRLCELLDLTPYSREEYLECKATWRDAADEVEMARRWFVSLQMSFSKTPSSQGWSYCKQPSGHAVSKFRGNVKGLHEAAQRFRMVQVEHMDVLELLARYDAPNVLFYIDPPYLPETRKSGNYHHEMTVEQHEALLTAAQQVQGKVLISGYHSPLYDAHLSSWHRYDMETVNWSSNKAREKRVECVWLSPNATQHQPELWTAVSATA